MVASSKNARAKGGKSQRREGAVAMRFAHASGGGSAAVGLLRALAVFLLSVLVCTRLLALPSLS